MIKNEEKYSSKRTLHGTKAGHSKPNSRFLHIFFMIKRRFRTAADKPSARRAAPRLVSRRRRRRHPCFSRRRRRRRLRSLLRRRRRRSCFLRWGCCHRLQPCPLRLRPLVKMRLGPPFRPLSERVSPNDILPDGMRHFASF